jgi:hypothetical protein
MLISHTNKFASLIMSLYAKTRSYKHIRNNSNTQVVLCQIYHAASR